MIRLFQLPVGLALLAAWPLHAAPRFAGVFGDQMVLQRDAPIMVWGWADPDEKVTVEFEGRQDTVFADAAGRWMAMLGALQANTHGQPLIATSAKTGESVRINDVLVGDIWLCSGQSNMAFTMGQLKNSIYSNDLVTASYPTIRLGTVPHRPSLSPTNEADVTWHICSPETVGSFTAAGFYFAREVGPKLGVPIGLVDSSWGGTSIESWISRDALDTVPSFKERTDKQIANLLSLPAQIKAFPDALAVWEKDYGRSDTTNRGEAEGWQKVYADVFSWSATRINASWKEDGLPNGGIAWLRKTVVLPNSSAGKAFRLDPGPVDEQYVTAYWNGVKIGETGRTPPHFYSGYINFNVPPRLMHAGTNVFALRFVVDMDGKSPVNRHALQLGFQDLGLSEMSDDCLVKVEKTFPPLSEKGRASQPATPQGDDYHTSSTLFGGMIQPLIPMAIKGCIWYQGEQDAGRAIDYRRLLPLMIGDWRSRWGGNFFFIIQQLPNWTADGTKNTSWAKLREAQALTGETVTNCLLSVAIDIGEANNVHPKNKREIGRRLALAALAGVYGQPIEYRGPVYHSGTVEGSSIRLKFLSANGLKSVDGQPLTNFAIAGADKTFFPATAIIESKTVVVASPRVSAPVAVRYAFINNPEGCNFSNDSGLPAMPFRTDDW